MDFLGYYFVATIILFLGGVVLIFGADSGWFSEFLITPGILLVILSIVSAGHFIVLGYSYVSAGTKAEILNRQFNTNYTQREVYFAGSLIEEIREMDRKRVEVNGDLFRDTSKDSK